MTLICDIVSVMKEMSPQHSIYMPLYNIELFSLKETVCRQKLLSKMYMFEILPIRIPVMLDVLYHLCNRLDKHFQSHKV